MENRQHQQLGQDRSDGRAGPDGRKPATVLVVGSANMDMVVSCERFPEPGETVLTDELTMFPGGKGANQAVACARLGGQVRFLGKVGDDVFRPRLLESLEAVGIDTDHVLVDPASSTGVALITVNDAGENQIIVVSGSNMQLTPDEIEAEQALFDAADVVLLQLEIPVEAVEKAARLAKEAGATVILNPAPACELPDALWQHVDILTPNESETAHLTGVRVTDQDTAETAARKLIQRGIRHVVVTLGADGVLLVTSERVLHVPGREVHAVDTTAAGDAFNGALAYALADGRDLDDALAFANTVAAYAVTQRGAQASMPTIDDLDAVGTAEAS
jgi:ribokinase